MRFDPLIANPGRLAILAALVAEDGQEFVSLRRLTQLSDGNLCTHARRLAAGGLIGVQKQFREEKPVTTFHLLPDGRQALRRHLDTLQTAMSESAPAPRTPATARPGRSKAPVAVRPAATTRAATAPSTDSESPAAAVAPSTDTEIPVAGHAPSEADDWLG